MCYIASTGLRLNVLMSFLKKMIAKNCKPLLIEIFYACTRVYVYVSEALTIGSLLRYYLGSHMFALIPTSIFCMVR